MSDCKCGCPGPILYPTRDAWMAEAVARKADNDIMADLLVAERAAHAETKRERDLLRDSVNHKTEEIRSLEATLRIWREAMGKHENCVSKSALKEFLA